MGDFLIIPCLNCIKISQKQAWPPLIYFAWAKSMYFREYVCRFSRKSHYFCILGVSHLNYIWLLEVWTWISNYTPHKTWDLITYPCTSLITNLHQQQWASYQIRNIAGCACAGNAGNVFPCHWLQRKPLVSGPGMHHGTCVTHVPWCMSGSLASGGGENVPGIPGACAPAIFRIW